ncbi:MAG: protein-export chaperone SecB [Gammaproteobacteria bacterium]|nr:MAG: protein-export chaperone SecB [Gammaproteobacteria bacterium]
MDKKNTPDINIRPDRAFSLLKVYLKDLSFEAPFSPGILTKVDMANPPAPSLKVNGSARKVGEDHYEYTLKLKVTAKIEDQIAYLIEVDQAGIFLIKGHSEEEMSEKDFRDKCPSALYPFARELIHEMVSRGGFGQELIGAFNFAALFAERQVGVDHQAEQLVKKQLNKTQ